MNDEMLSIDFDVAWHEIRGRSGVKERLFLERKTENASRAAVLHQKSTLSPASQSRGKARRGKGSTRWIAVLQPAACNLQQNKTMHVGKGYCTRAGERKERKKQSWNQSKGFPSLAVQCSAMQIFAGDPSAIVVIQSVCNATLFSHRERLERSLDDRNMLSVPTPKDGSTDGFV